MRENQQKQSACNQSWQATVSRELNDITKGFEPIYSTFDEGTSAAPNGASMACTLHGIAIVLMPSQACEHSLALPCLQLLSHSFIARNMGVAPRGPMEAWQMESRLNPAVRWFLNLEPHSHPSFQSATAIVCDVPVGRVGLWSDAVVLAMRHSRNICPNIFGHTHGTNMAMNLNWAPFGGHHLGGDSCPPITF